MSARPAQPRGEDLRATVRTDLGDLDALFQFFEGYEASTDPGAKLVTGMFQTLGLPDLALFKSRLKPLQLPKGRRPKVAIALAAIRERFLQIEGREPTIPELKKALETHPGLGTRLPESVARTSRRIRNKSGQKPG